VGDKIKKLKFMSAQSEIYSNFLYRYQTEGVPKGMSIEHYCFKEGVEYPKFMSWYRENKTRLHKEIQEELKVFPIKVLVEKKNTQMPGKTSQADRITVEHLEMKLSNGIEINKEKVNLQSVLELLQNLSTIC